MTQQQRWHEGYSWYGIPPARVATELAVRRQPTKFANPGGEEQVNVWWQPSTRAGASERR
jgi:hypothetical protein